MDQPPTPSERHEIHITLSGLSTRQLIMGLGGSALSLAIAAGVIIAIKPNLIPRGSAFTNTQLAQISGFKPYYLKAGQSTDFVIDKSSVSYQDKILVFALTNPAGKTLAFTEQSLPPNFDPSTITTTKQFSTEYGQAMVTDTPDRTTGTLFTTDHTWIVINAPSPIGVDTMERILNNLGPVAEK